MNKKAKEIDLWILAGQSNMEGVGELSQALAPNDEVFCFSSAGNWEIATEPLHRFWESFTPVHQDLCRADLAEESKHLSDKELAMSTAAERQYGTGLGLAFGQAMSKVLNRPIGLLPCAHGGTSLEQWSPDKKSEGGRSLYGAMFERIKRSGGTPRGLLWYQGESDAWNSETGASYGPRFEQWIKRLRDDIGDPTFPVLIVQISRTTLDSPDPSAWNQIQQVQYDLPTRLPYTAVTSAIDLPLVDCIHINANGLKRLGGRLARLALAMTTTPNALSGPRLLRAESQAEPPDRGLVRLSFSGVSGGWLPADHMAGFDILTAEGQAHPINRVINAFRDLEDPTVIWVRLNIPLQSGDKVVYGIGLNTYCNVTDEADQPLCACSIADPLARTSSPIKRNTVI